MRLSLLLALLPWIASCDDGDASAIPDEPACTNCTIEIEPILQIGAEDGPGSLTGRPYSIRQDGRGRYWIEVLDAFPLLYDSAGNFLQPLGQPGDGPGEYRDLAIRSLLPGDSALVRSRSRYLIFGPDLNPARAVEVSPRWELGPVAVLQWPENVISLSSSYNQRTQISTSHVVRYEFSDSIATVIDTVVTIPAEASDPTSWANSLRILGEPAPDHVWLMNQNRYKLVRLDGSGNVGDSVVRQPDWFPGGEPIRLGAPGKPASPHMMNSWVDDSGYLWVLASKPREGTDALWEGSPSGAMEARVASLPAPYKLHQTMIEVIDLDSRSVRVRHLFDGYIFAMLPGNRVASYEETAMGIPIITIHRIGVAEP